MDLLAAVGNCQPLYYVLFFLAVYPSYENDRAICGANNRCPEGLYYVEREE
ncbi:hypothetical protein ERJ70_07200 [Sediminibacillus dalangtanensis]|uniref:Uncharacterized protein n=1 Tax=Sediminibacillus dalangtanensis TaxID=2729421 RepID=A0ABX7VR34_9BACI|nr:hypothetical protein [Sediminibacillus dalangtanensis]QTM99106.1 hypothetical protein ERJ70_07200 [Sediminibacillus dalangtanensis]